MSTNPFVNAAAATIYIAVISSILHYGQEIGPTPDTILAPITMLSLLVLSVSVMGFLFFYSPLALYMEGKHKEAVALFLKTVAIFGCLTFALLLALVAGSS